MKITSKSAYSLPALGLIAFSLGAQAQQATPTYAARCASCHGADMKGASAPSILAWIRYHTNNEVSALVAKGTGKMKGIQIPDAEKESLMGDLRKLAGTNPTMATGGFTGVRPGRGAGGPNGAAPPPAGAPDGAPARGGRGGQQAAVPQGPPTLSPLIPVTGPKASPDRTGQQATIRVGTASLTGKILSDYTDSTTIATADGKIHLLARAGESYTEKKLEPSSNWTTYHGMMSGNRYSSLEQINLGNVNKLTPAWGYLFPPSAQNGRFEATPLVVDGIMYTTAWNEIYALDATTGQLLWSHAEPHTAGVLSDAGSGANRGAAVAGDRVFMTTDHAHLMAFDRKIGTKLWDVELGSYKDLVTSSGAPMVVGDLVMAGVAGGEEGMRGFLDAYNVVTGKRVWRFYTIPARGEPGSETWKGAALEHGCGTTWLTGSYDAALETLYWAVGNPCPDMNGEERIGDNLWTASVVALNIKTGKMKWYYQFTPHDTHDWDAVQSMILVDEAWEGSPRKLLMHGDRNGMFYVLDRTNGKFLLGSNLSTKVTWNKGFTKEGRPILADVFETTRQGIAACPGLSGGANWQSESYSPITKLFYARVSDSCATYQSGEDPLTAGNRWFGTGAPVSQDAQKALAALREGYPGGTFIRALDPFTGKKVWDYPANNIGSGILTTAGGLAIVGGGGGITFLDAKTGKLVHSIDVGQNARASAMTYMVGGKQYIALGGSSALVAYTLPAN